MDHQEAVAKLFSINADELIAEARVHPSPVGWLNDLRVEVDCLVLQRAEQAAEILDADVFSDLRREFARITTELNAVPKDAPWRKREELEAERRELNQRWLELERLETLAKARREGSDLAAFIAGQAQQFTDRAVASLEALKKVRSDA